MRNVAATHLDVDPDRLLPGARLGEDLCVDSLDAIELTMVLEDEFDIALPERRGGLQVRTYGDVVTLVREQVVRPIGRAPGPASRPARLCPPDEPGCGRAGRRLLGRCWGRIGPPPAPGTCVRGGPGGPCPVTRGRRRWARQRSGRSR